MYRRNLYKSYKHFLDQVKIKDADSINIMKVQINGHLNLNFHEINISGSFDSRSTFMNCVLIT